MKSINKNKIIIALCEIFVLGMFFTFVSCGYRMVGSRFLPFNSVTIKAVENKTYEPRLEEKLNYALSNEFISQGIAVRKEGGDVELEATVTSFLLGAIGAVNEMVKEQELIMEVDIKVTDKGRVTEFKNMKSPIVITFESTGTVGQTASNKERATEKACREIAKELVGQIILKYAQ